MTEQVTKEESDTPMTDAVVWYAEEDSMPTIPVVHAGFARQLERRITKLEAVVLSYLVERHGFIRGPVKESQS